MHNVPTGGSETFPSTSGEKDKFLPNRQEVGQIWTTSTWYDAHDFLQKSFLGSQYAILSKNNASWARLGEIQVYTKDATFKYPINSKMLIQKMRH